MNVSHIPTLEDLVMKFSTSIIFVILVFIHVVSSTAIVHSSEDGNSEIEDLPIVNIDDFESLEVEAMSSIESNFSRPSTFAHATNLELSKDDHLDFLQSQTEDNIANNTRCSQTHLSFTKETLLHIWEIKGLVGYISYIKRFEQPFEIKTDHVSFKSDNVDGKWLFKVHKVRHHNPFSVLSSATSASSSSASYSSGHVHDDLGDIRIIATYSYEAKQPRNINFIIKPTIIHGSKEIKLPPKRSTSPTIVQQKFYNTRGYQLNSNFLEYVYTFTWSNVMQPLNNIKSNLFSAKYSSKRNGESEESPSAEAMQKQQPAYFLHSSDNFDEASEELFEEITKTDFSGHFGDITVKFVISAYFPEEPVSFTSSRCNASLLDSVGNNLMEEFTLPSKHSQKSLRKDFTKQHRSIGNGVPPYLRYSYSMLHDDRFADVLLVVGQDELPAHKIILATSSPVFSAIFENITSAFAHSLETGRENQTGCDSTQHQRLFKVMIDPQDVEIDSVQELLRYIYTGTVDSHKMMDDFLVRNLIILAERYGLPELKHHCESLLLQKLTADNAVVMYLLGTRISSEKITRKALIVMKLNKAKVAGQTTEFKELSMRHPALMYDLFLSD